MTVRNDGSPTGPVIPPTTLVAPPPPSGTGTPVIAPADAPTIAAAGDQGPLKVPATGGATPSVSLLTPPPSKAASLDPAAGPHDPFRPGPGVTQDKYNLGMYKGFYRLGFSRTSTGGDFNLGVMANQTGGGVTIGAMNRTPLGSRMSLAWGAQLEATGQKLGETTLISLNPDILAQLRYNDSNNQLALNAGLYTRAAVGWNKGAVDRNKATAEGLADTIKQEFDSLKAKIAARIDQLKGVGDAFLTAAQALLPPARDQFAQLLQQRLSAQLGAAANELLPIITTEVGNAFGAYMGSLSTIIGNMQSAMQSAATANTPAQMQSAIADFAAGLGQLQAATAPGSLDPYMATLQQRLVEALGPAGAAQAAAIGAIISQTASEVGATLASQLQGTANEYLTQANKVLTDLFGDAASALNNTVGAAQDAAGNYEQMTTVALQSRIGIGLEYSRRIGFLSNNAWDLSTTATVGGNYYHPVFDAAWADKGLPNPMVVQSAAGPMMDFHAGMGVQKWFGTMAVGANAGYRGQVAGGQYSGGPEFGISFMSRFSN